MNAIRNRLSRLLSLLQRIDTDNRLWHLALLLLLGYTTVQCLPALSGDWYRSGNDMEYILPPLRHVQVGDVQRWLKGPWIGVELFAYYRPVTSLLWWMEFRAFGENARSWQLISLILHLVCTVCLTLLLSRVFPHRIAALVGGLGWATRHKIVETLEWTPAQTDHFAVFFGIIALYLLQWALDHIRERKRMWFGLVTAAVSCLLAMGSKEIAYTVPLLGVLFVLRHPALPRRTKVVTIVGVLALLGGFAVWRIIAMQGIGFLPGTATTAHSRATTLTPSRWLKLMATYLLPAPLNPVALIPVPATIATFALVYGSLRLRHRLWTGLALAIGSILCAWTQGGVEYIMVAGTYQLMLVALSALFIIVFTVRQRPMDALFVFIWGLVGYLPLYHVVYNAAGNVNYLPGTYWAFGWTLFVSAIWNFVGTPKTETV